MLQLRFWTEMQELASDAQTVYSQLRTAGPLSSIGYSAFWVTQSGILLVRLCFASTNHNVTPLPPQLCSLSCNICLNPPLLPPTSQVVPLRFEPANHTLPSPQLRFESVNHTLPYPHCDLSQPIKFCLLPLQAADPWNPQPLHHGGGEFHSAQPVPT